MRIEIAHDTLAKAIFGKASAEEKMRLRVQRLVKERYAFAQEMEDVYLQEVDLELIKPMMGTLSLDSEEKQFVQQSAERLNKQRQRRERLTFLFIVIPVAFIFVAGSVFAYQYKSAKHQEWQMAEQHTDSLYTQVTYQTEVLEERIDDVFAMLGKAKEQAYFIDKNKSSLVGLSRRNEDIESFLPDAQVDMDDFISKVVGMRPDTSSASGTAASNGTASERPIEKNRRKIDLLSDTIVVDELKRVDALVKERLSKLKRKEQ